MRRGDAGFTVLELLIAAAVAAVVLTVAALLYSSSARAYRVNEEVSEVRQGIQAAISLLQYEIGLAGYRCTDDDALTRAFSGQPLVATDGASGSADSITVRYYEDRYVSGSCELTEVTYFVQDGSLYRQVTGEDAQEAVHGVVDMQVEAWLDRAQSMFVVATDSAALNRPLDPDLRGVSLSLRFTDAGGRENPVIVTVGLKNPQCASLGDCL